MAATGNGAGSASNFILNIVELQNTITSASGTTPVESLSASLSQLQEMVIYSEKRIAANTISAYNTTPIQVTDSLNMADGTSFTINGATVSTSGGGVTANYATVSTIGTGTSYTNYFSTTASTDTGISFQVSGGTPLSVQADGTVVISNALRIVGAGTPALGRYLTCLDAAGNATWQDPAIPSDGRWKEEIREIGNVYEILGGIRGVRFRWSNDGAQDVGVIAQDVMRVLPEAVIEGVDGRPHMVAYQKLIPVLVEVVKDLRARVEELERAAPRG